MSDFCNVHYRNAQVKVYIDLYQIINNIYFLLYSYKSNVSLLFFGLSGISAVFPVIQVFPVTLGTDLGLIHYLIVVALGATDI